MKKKLSKNKMFYFIMIILIAIVLIITGIKAYKEFFAKSKEENVVVKEELDKIDLFAYTLDDHDTKLYGEYFEELKTILNEEKIDYEKYASSIVKLFVTDFYSLDAKLTSGDFGGLEFIHPELKDNFMLNAGDTIYNHIKTNIDGNRKQDLPMVKSVTIDSVKQSIYTYNEKDYDSYVVSASWEYEKDMGYESEGEFTLIEYENKLYIVEK